jgi:hypothetical protein
MGYLLPFGMPLKKIPYFQSMVFMKVRFENIDGQTAANLAIVYRYERCLISLTVYIFKLHTSQKDLHPVYSCTSTLPLLLNGGSFSKASAPPLFLEDENIFQQSAFVVALLWRFLVQPRRPDFEKCSHLREKGGVLIFFPSLYGGLYGQNLPYKF